MKRLLYLLLALCAFGGIMQLHAVAANDDKSRKMQLAKSDSLFAVGVDLYNAGKYQEAIPLFTESDKIDKAVLDSTSNRRSYSAQWIAGCYYKLGNEDAAKEWYKFYTTKPVDRRLTVVSDSISAIGMEYFDRDDYKNAIPYFTRCGEIEKQVVGGNSIWYANTLVFIAICNAEIGDSSETIRLMTQALDVFEKALGKEHAYYVSILSSWASYNYNIGNYDEAIRLEKEALQIREKVLGKEHPDYATSLNNLAFYNSSVGNYTEAVRLGTDALRIYEKVYGKEHLTLATWLNRLAFFNTHLGNYAEAARLSTEALQVLEKETNQESSEYATCLSSIADSKLLQANYVEAIRLGTEAHEIYVKIFGKEHPIYATSLSALADYNGVLGNYAEAIRLATEALKMREKIFGKEHPYYATSLSSLADYNRSLGNYAEVFNLETEALCIREKVYGTEHPEYAQSLASLANYNSLMGNYTEAVRLGTKALKIYEKVYGKEHPMYAETLSSLADYNYSLGNYAEVIRMETEALRIFEKTVGKEHPDYASSLDGLAMYNVTLENYAEAVQQGTEALRIREKVYGKEHPNYAASLNNMAIYHSSLGNYSEAIQLATEALRIREKVLGKEHPDYTLSLTNLACYQWLQNSTQAIRPCVEATDLKIQTVRNTFADLIANERNLFWNKEKVWFEHAIHDFAFQFRSDSLYANGYNGLLLSKGLLLNSEIALSTLLQEAGDKKIEERYNELKLLRLQTERQMEKPISERTMNVDSMRTVARSMERELMQRSKTYGDYTQNLVIDWKQVQDKLGDKDIAIEFASFPTGKDSIMYVAYYLRKGMETPKMMPLFEAKQLKEIPIYKQYTSPAISQLVWQPLAAELGNVETVYFSPAGELYNIAIESLPHWEKEGLVSDQWNFYRLSSTRELALIKDKNEMKRASVYGGLAYDMGTDVLVKDSKKYAVKRDFDTSTLAIADSLNLRSGVKELPGSKIEAVDINALLKKMRVDSKLYIDSIGTETSFKALSGKRQNVLHIGTHGFYWTETEAKSLSSLSFLSLLDNDNRPRYVEDKALTRSGLLFAGANRALKGETLPENVDDGILTAKEISTLDLRGLDLVVLSACQTGLGEITGDGVFGLQRGFKKAGANALLMTLWEVRDDATHLLMTHFFENMAAGMDKHAALLDAQKYVREYEEEKIVKLNDNLTSSQKKKLQKEGKKVVVQTKTRRERPYEHPAYWAAFILLDGLD